MHEKRGEEFIERTAINNNAMGKRPLATTRLRPDECVSKEDVGRVKPGVQRREAAEDGN